MRFQSKKKINIKKTQSKEQLWKFKNVRQSENSKFPERQTHKEIGLHTKI